LQTRVRGVAVPGCVNFPEVNLRFYVRRGDRRGVVFVREFVSSRLIAWVARTIYGEPYRAVPMRDRVTGATRRYEWQWAGRWHSLAAEVSGEPVALPVGSVEEFILEHYWGYTRRGSATWEYAVEHPRWRIRRVTNARLDCDVAAVYGPEFLPALGAAPASVVVAEGSRVTVRAGQRMG
jgi:uncharacterized protein YqjF (DUF2071 family)